MPTAPKHLSVRPFTQGDRCAWQRFVAEKDAPLFADLDFLAYHPGERHRFLHLLVFDGEGLAAIVPGGLQETQDGIVYRSPLGASSGGPVWHKRLLLADALALVDALVAFAQDRGWHGIDYVLSPRAYSVEGSDTLPFALSAKGFKLVGRDLCFGVRIGPPVKDGFERLFRGTQANLVRQARRKGMAVSLGGAELFDDFTAVFEETYARHGVAPTHTSDEIADLLRRLPDRMRLVVASLDDAPVAGLLVFLIDSRVATTMYICNSTARGREHGVLVAIAALIDELASKDFGYLDLGPSASNDRVNAGVVQFKESVGAFGYARDHWALRLISHPNAPNP